MIVEVTNGIGKPTLGGNNLMLTKLQWIIIMTIVYNMHSISEKWRYEQIKITPSVTENEC